MSSKSSYSTILRYTRVLAALGAVVAGIRHSCSGYAGFWIDDLRAILRYTGVLAALGSVVAGILHSCSGYAGLRPWLLAAAPRRQENAKMRVGRRSTGDFALYRCFGRAGLCRG